MIALLVMTDGRRDCIELTVASAREMLAGPITEMVIHDDSGDPEYAAWLDSDPFAFYDTPCTVVHTPGRSGFGGAIRSAWNHLRLHSQAPYVFHLEDDFTFNRPVDLVAMISVLDANPHLVQLALRRQPWNEQERAAGGIVEQHPDDYTDVFEYGERWLEHRRFFTTNPSLYRRSLIEHHDWPDGAHSEGRFGINLLEQHPDWRFAYWGARDSGEWCTHIGRERVGTGY